MGLLNRRESAQAAWLSRIAYWQVALALIAVSVVVAGFGDMGREALMYDRLAIASGEHWRLVSGHFTHLGNRHLALNLAGLVLSWLLVGRNYSSAEWLVILLLAITAISAGFWFLDENMLWYVGLSGVLHGLLIAGAIRGLKTLPVESAVICLLVAGKLLYEQIVGPLPGSESVSGGTVVVNAHLYGAMGGVVAAGLLWHRARAATAI